MNRFGFIAHPINIKSLYDFLGITGVFAKALPKRLIKTIAEKLPPCSVCSFDRIRSSAGVEIKGEIVALPLTPMQIASLPEEKVLNLIEKGIRRCEKNGAKIVGLGGFASVVGNEGEVLSKRVSVPLTSGNTLTSALALEGIYKAAYIMNIYMDKCTAAIIGATGDIGSICTKILSKRVRKIHIVARDEQKLEEFANSIREYGSAEVSIFKKCKDAVQNADIILTATSALTTVIDPINLKPGAVVCDVAIPADIAREVVQARDDILVFEGGLAKIAYMEDVKNKKLLNTIPSKGIYGCVAETMVLAFEERFESYSLGRGNITEKKMEEIKEIADMHGVELSDFFCGYKFFSEKDIANIRKKAIKNKEKIYVS